MSIMVFRHAVVLAVFATTATVSSAAYGVTGGINGAEAGLWKNVAVIIATIGHSAEGTENETVEIEPIATMCGDFDSGRRMSLIAFTHTSLTSSAIFELPKFGTLALVVVQRRPADWDDRNPLELWIPSSFVSFLSTRNAIAPLTSLTDAEIQTTLNRLQRLRSDQQARHENEQPSAIPRVADRDCTLIFADVVKISPNAPSSPNVTMTLRGIRDEAGAAKDGATVDIIIPLRSQKKLGIPAVGAKLLVSFVRLDLKAGKSNWIPPETFGFMPVDGAPVYIANRDTDPSVSRAFDAIKSLKHWQTHDVIYAEIKQIADLQPGESSRKMVLRPKLALTGTFDPAAKSEITISVVESLLKNQSPPKPGTMALFYLVRTGDSYSVSTEPAAFMPGDDHSPICSVWDFSDRRVADTCKAIQVLRSKENIANSKAGKP